MEKTTQLVNIENGKIGVVAEYAEQVIADYQGNPLIETLPPIMTEDEAVIKLSNYPLFSDKERELDLEHRLHCVYRLNSYYQVLDKGIDLERKISRALRQGYTSRSPLSKEFKLRLHEGSRLINEKKSIFEYNSNTTNTGIGFTMLGVSGMGKSTALERVLSTYPQIYIHSEYNGFPMSLYQVTYLKFDCPNGGSLKGLCLKFFNAIDELLGTNYTKRLGNVSRVSVEYMSLQMQQIASLHCLGLLVIDEIQRLNVAGIGSTALLDFFVTLVNEIGLPVILVGTPKAVAILQKEFRQARRGTGQGDMIFDRMEYDETWKLLIEGMWRYQWTKSKNEITEELMEAIFYESQGIIDVAIKLYMLSQIDVMGNGKEQITVSVIKKVAKRDLRLLKPMLDALKSGSLKSIGEFKDITPICIEDFIERKKKDNSWKERARQLQELEKMRGIGTEDEKFKELAIKLMELGIQQKKAENVSRRALTELGHGTSFSELLKLAGFYAFADSEISNTKDTKTRKTKNTVEFQENDLRKIYEISKEAKVDVYSRLKEKNVIKNPLDEFQNGAS